MLDLIVKPQKGKRDKELKRIEARLKERGVAYEMHYTASQGDAVSLARRLSEAGRREIVAVGGDGTFNEVLCGLDDPVRCTLGLIPLGTGNDFAATAGIPYGLDALDLILGGTPAEIDYIEFSDGRRSLNITGVGLDVDIIERSEKKHGKGKYIRSMLVSLFRFRGIRLTASANGEEHTVNAFIAAVCNGKQCGGGIPTCPPAEIDDGKLELMYVEYPKFRKIPVALIKLMKGKIYDLPFAHRVTCESAVIRPEKPCNAQFDGELHRVETLEARIVHGLRIYRKS